MEGNKTKVCTNVVNKSSRSFSKKKNKAKPNQIELHTSSSSDFVVTFNSSKKKEDKLYLKTNETQKTKQRQINQTQTKKVNTIPKQLQMNTLNRNNAIEIQIVNSKQTNK